MGCNIGCGCGKARENRRDRSNRLAAAAQKKRTEERLKAKAKSKGSRLASKKMKYDTIANRLSICKSCPNSIQTPIDKKRFIRQCNQVNKPIKEISVSINFRCPIEKF